MTEYNADKAQENAAREEATHEESMHNKTTQEKAAQKKTAQKKAAQEVTGSEQRKASKSASPCESPHPDTNTPGTAGQSPSSEKLPRVSARS